MTFWRFRACPISKILNSGNLPCRLQLQIMPTMWAALLGTEQGLKHFNQPLTYFLSYIALGHFFESLVTSRDAKILTHALHHHLVDKSFEIFVRVGSLHVQPKCIWGNCDPSCLMNFSRFLLGQWFRNWCKPILNPMADMVEVLKVMIPSIYNCFWICFD